MTNEEVVEKFRKQKKIKKYVLQNTQKDPDYDGNNYEEDLNETSFSAPNTVIDEVPTETGPESNAGRDTCYWCDQPTRLIDLLFGSTEYCDACDK